MMTPNDPIASSSRATAVDALAALRGAGISSANAPETAEFLRELEAACEEAGIDFTIAASHCGNETNLFRDDLFRLRRNPAGIGVTGEPGVLGPIFPSYRAAARFYVAELLLKLRLPLGTFADARRHAPEKFDAVAALANGSEGPFPSVTRIGDLNRRFGPIGGHGLPRECVWMCDETGPEAICQKAELLFPNLPPPRPAVDRPFPRRRPDMPFSTMVPGLPGGPLETDYPIHVDLIPISQRQRPGRKASLPRRCVQHGNGNPDSSAAGERNFLHNGADGAQLSYHSTGDDREVFVMVPADEVTFQAADGPGPGNENGFSCEMVEDANLWADPARRDRVIHICADFMGRVAARLNIAIPEQHFDFNWVQCCPQPCDVICIVNHQTGASRHNCPDKLRHVRMPDGRLAWEVYVQRWHAARTDELQRMNPFPPLRIPIPAGALEIDIPGIGLLPLRRNTPVRFVATAEGKFFTAPATEAPVATQSGYRVGKICRFTHRAAIGDKNWLVSRRGSWAPAADFDRA